MSLLQAILMGLLQGITEFLPVSSSGHLAIFQYIFKVNTDTGMLFEVMLHLGTLVAVCIVFWKDVSKLFIEGIRLLVDVCPQETHDIVARFLDGDVAGSRELQLRALPLVHALFCEVNPIPVKTAMNLMGMEVGPLRLPMTPMEEANKARLIQAMKDFGITIKE